MGEFTILTDDFAESAARAGRSARQAALAAGHCVVFLDAQGRYIEERPDGRQFEIRLDGRASRDAHRVVLREFVSTAA